MAMASQGLMSADGVMRCTLDCQSRGTGAIPASALHFHENQKADAAKLVTKYHYSHRLPANIQYVGTLHKDGGLFGDLGEAVAAVFFSLPPTRWSEEVLELSRLVRKDTITVELSRLIGMACRRLKQRQWDLLVSFADTTYQHHGGIYQAASWEYHGCRPSRRDGNIINGRFYPCRTLNSVYGTNSVERLKRQHPEWDVVPHYDNGKHLYWRALGRRGMKKAHRLGLRSMEYPKPSLDRNGDG